VSEQIIDLRSTWATLRRSGGVLLVATCFGAGVGGAAAYLWPPSYSSTSIVLLPPTPQASSGAAPVHTIDTQVQIANSEVVLGPAGRAVTPQLSAAQMDDRIDVTAPTNDVLTITATGATPAQAEAMSRAVAKAEVDYLAAAASTLGAEARDALESRSATLKNSLASVTSEIGKTQGRLSKESPSSAPGRADAAALAELTAQQANIVLQLDQIQNAATAGSQPSNGQPGGGAKVIQDASPAVSMPFALRVAAVAGTGAALAFVLVATVLLLRDRRARTLRSRDEIADAVGVAVAASIQSRAPRTPAGWISLLRDYAPEHVETWTLRQLLRLVTPGAPGSIVEELGPSPQAGAVVVITIAGDKAALAAGPQFASFAASTGTSTRLVAAQKHESATSLWAACSGLHTDGNPRTGLTVGTRPAVDHPGELVVLIAVLDRHRPKLLLPGVENAVTLLAVTPGTATAEDLARAALAADDAGLPIDRIVVVDADPIDRSTGRLLPSERAQHVQLPSLMTGSAVAGEANALETRRRLR
jgi:capsular polysaccharide biosynthesis protein